MPDPLQYLIDKPIEGSWWLADAPDIIFEGTLQLDQSLQGVLNLKGSRGELTSMLSRTLQGEQYTLYGSTERGIRLWSLFNTGMTRGPNEGRDPDEVTEAMLYTNDVLMGHHVPDAKAAIVVGAWLELSGLESWCDETGFAVKGDGKGGNIRVDGVTVDFTNTHTDWIALDDKTKLRISSIYRGSRVFSRRKSVTLDVVDAFDLRFDEPISVEQSSRIFDIWQSFLTFSTRRPSYRKVIGLRLAVPGCPPDGHPYAFLTPGRRETGEQRLIGPRNVVLSQSKLGPRFADALSAWWRLFDRIETPVMLYTGTAYQEGAYLHVRLLAYLQTLEILHRELYGGSRQFPNECSWATTLAALRKALPSELPEELRCAISNGLSFQGGMNLVERLYDFYDRYPLCLAPIFPNRDSDMKALRDARNFLTHYTEQKKFTREFLFSTELYRMSEKTRLFVEVCLMGALGFKDNEIRELIRFFEPYSEATWQSRKF